MSLGGTVERYALPTATATVGVIGRSIPAVVVDSTTCSKHMSRTRSAQQNFGPRYSPLSRSSRNSTGVISRESSIETATPPITAIASG